MSIGTHDLVLFLALSDIWKYRLLTTPSYFYGCHERSQPLSLVTLRFSSKGNQGKQRHWPRLGILRCWRSQGGPRGPRCRRGSWGRRQRRHQRATQWLPWNKMYCRTVKICKSRKSLFKIASSSCQRWAAAAARLAGQSTFQDPDFKVSSGWFRNLTTGGRPQIQGQVRECFQGWWHRQPAFCQYGEQADPGGRSEQPTCKW